MMISLDQQIQKDRENDYYRRRDRREGYRNRRQQHYSRGYQDTLKRNYPQRVRPRYKQRSYQDRLSPQNRQRSIIKISNLHYSVDKEQLETICSAFGKVKTCRIDWDKMGRSNETAIVEFYNREDEEHAVKQLSGMKIEGQEIKAEIVARFSVLAAKKHHQINKAYSKYQGGKYYRRS